MHYNNNDDNIVQYFSRKDLIATWLPIFLLILLLLVAFLVSFYYFHDWKWGKYYNNIMVEYQHTLYYNSGKLFEELFNFFDAWSLN